MTSSKQHNKNAPKGKGQSRPEIRDIPIPRPHAAATEDFAPYLDRAIAGDLGALVEYFRNSFDPSDPAFYECLGYIVAHGSDRQRNCVQRIMRSSIWTGKKIRKATFEHWKRKLTPFAEDVARRITEKRKNQGGSVIPRAQLWDEYLNTSRVFSSLSNEDKAVLRRGTWNNGKVIYLRQYLDAGLIPKELFWLVAQTKPHVAPSEAIRKYMAGPPLRLSWSGPTRRSESLRKN